MKKILLIFGTRPEAIKMAPLFKKFQEFKYEFETRVCVTAQHREMLDQVLDFFQIKPHYDLNLMKSNQSLHALTATIINSLQPVLEEFNPDYVFVHGDTTTSLASALAGFYTGSKICHVEAGLRTYNKLSPFPEEINRQLVSRLSDYHFAPTYNSKNNLLKENIEEKSILVTGNTVIDALFESVEKVKSSPTPIVDWIQSKLKDQHNVILVTGHRRENHGEGFERICSAIKAIAEKKPDVQIIYPVHLNPHVQEIVQHHLSDIDNIILIDPLSYPDFIWLMNRSKLIISDSGGIQEEAPSLGKPVLLLRETTERPEAVDAGAVILVGTDKDLIVSEVIDLLENERRYNSMNRLTNPYGDGNACNRIVEFIRQVEQL